METLDKTHRVVICLFYYEDLSVKEIGKVLNITSRAAKTRLSRAREALRKELERYERI